MVESYIKGTLFANPTLYLDILEKFWTIAEIETIALVDWVTKPVINYKIKDVVIGFDASDINKALELLEDFAEEATNAQLTEFADFINYADTIDLVKINKKHVRKEWSFVYDTVLRVLVGQKTGFDQISKSA